MPLVRRASSLLAVLLLLLVAADGAAHAIVNGTAAAPGEHPHIVALQSRGGGEQFCGGALVAVDRVVTAAHCLEGERPSSIEVAAGAVALGDPSAQVRGVRDMWIAEDPEVNDVAVLHLDAPFEVGGSVRTIELVDPVRDAELVDAGSPALVAGWGATSENGEAVNRLLDTVVEIVDDATCRDRHDPELAGAVQVCTISATGNDSCYGDSGGPLVVVDPADGEALLLGVVSYGTDDCGSGAGVYSEAPAFAEFLRTDAAPGPAAGDMATGGSLGELFDEVWLLVRRLWDALLGAQPSSPVAEEWNDGHWDDWQDDWADDWADDEWGW